MRDQEFRQTKWTIFTCIFFLQSVTIVINVSVRGRTKITFVHSLARPFLTHRVNVTLTQSLMYVCIQFPNLIFCRTTVQIFSKWFLNTFSISIVSFLQKHKLSSFVSITARNRLGSGYVRSSLNLAWTEKWILELTWLEIHYLRNIPIDQSRSNSVAFNELTHG